MAGVSEEAGGLLGPACFIHWTEKAGSEVVGLVFGEGEGGCAGGN